MKYRITRDGVMAVLVDARTRTWRVLGSVHQRQHRIEVLKLIEPQSSDDQALLQRAAGGSMRAMREALRWLRGADLPDRDDDPCLPPAPWGQP